MSEARKLRTSDVDLFSGKAVVYQSKGRKDRIIYIAKDLCELLKEYILILEEIYGVELELLFPASKPQNIFRVSSLNKKFHEFWMKTQYSNNNINSPTVHSLRHSFVVIRTNKWMGNGIELKGMMPYLCKYLGHTSVDNTFYYYHQVQSAFKIIRNKDLLSKNIIPEVFTDE
ncbi:MAG: tyrosine-type recombinase/integrase [Alkaliphilus sp.]